MDSLNGCEFHRLTTWDHYNPEVFNRLYKAAKPLITNLSYGIDTRKYNVSIDIIRSYFWDKFLFVYNKYQDLKTEPELKGLIFSSLRTYKNKLLKAAYGQVAEFHNSCHSLEELFDNSKEDRDADIENDEDPEKAYREELYQKLDNYVKSKLSADEYILYRTELDLPPFLEERRYGRKPSIIDLCDYFGIPRDNKSKAMFTQMRKHIDNVLLNARIDLNK